MAIDNFYSYPLRYYFYLYKVKIKDLKKDLYFFFSYICGNEKSNTWHSYLDEFCFSTQHLA